VPDHPVLVRVGDRAGFEFPHRPKRFLDQRSHLFEKTIRKTHSADVDREVEIVVTQTLMRDFDSERRLAQAILDTACA